MRRQFATLIAATTLLVACSHTPDSASPAPQSETKPPASAVLGMVSSAHPIATRAGIAALESGGNAFDAAVSIAATLNVVEPMMSGVGGYGTILIYDSELEEVRFLDSSGRIPASVDSDVFRPPYPNYKENRRGPKAVSTPGNVNAWEALSSTYGRLSWENLFSPAIAAAKDGFEVESRTARLIASAWKDFPARAREIYGRDGEPLGPGDRLVQTELAETLRTIATEGARSFYTGAIGQRIDAEMRRSGGFLRLSDLASDAAEWWKPISIDYRGYQVFTAAPPSTAFPSLIRLGMMSRIDLGPDDHNTTEMLHNFIETTKHAYRCRLAHAGDPEVAPPPLDLLLSEKYWQDEVSAFNADSAQPFGLPSQNAGLHGHTTHFVVADRWGNIVSATQTL